MFKRLAEAKIAFSPKGKIFQFLGALVNFIKKPFVAIGTKIKNIFTGMSLGLAAFADKIGGLFTSSGKSTIFTRAVNRIKDLFSKQGPLSRFFGFFARIQGVFIGIGQVVGKLLWPIFALIGFIKGAKKGVEKESDTANKLIRGTISGIGGIFRILIGEFLDFLKQLLGFIIDLIPGVDGVREKFKEFSFAVFFDGLYNMIADSLITSLNMIRDTIADIGVEGIAANLATGLYLAVQKMMAFPKAIVAGGIGALKNMFSDPVGGFQEAFNKKMANESARIEALGEAMYIKADGRKEDGSYIKGLSEEGEALRMKAMAQDGVPISNELYQQSIKGGDTVIVQSEPESPFTRLFSNTASD